MPTYDFHIFNVAEYAWSGWYPFPDSDAPGINPGESFSFSAVATAQPITVTDANTDAALTDKGLGTQVIDFADPTRTVTVENGTFGNGTEVETAWKYTVNGSDGSQITLWGVTFGANTNEVRAIVSDGTLRPGVTCTIASNPAPSTNSGAPYAALVCFGAGTRIACPDGARRVETLRPGALVLTERGAEPLRWVFRRHLGPEALALEPKLRPIRIGRGSLGPDMPAADLLVSPQHRMVIRARAARRI